MNTQTMLDLAVKLQEIQVLAEANLDDRRLQMIEELCASILVTFNDEK